jgi:hypothetical protein
VNRDSTRGRCHEYPFEARGGLARARASRPASRPGSAPASGARQRSPAARDSRRSTRVPSRSRRRRHADQVGRSRRPACTERCTATCTSRRPSQQAGRVTGVIAVPNGTPPPGVPRSSWGHGTNGGDVCAPSLSRTASSRPRELTARPGLVVTANDYKVRAHRASCRTSPESARLATRSTSCAAPAAACAREQALRRVGAFRRRPDRDVRPTSVARSTRRTAARGRGRGAPPSQFGLIYAKRSRTAPTATTC